MAPAFSRLPDCRQRPGPAVYNPSFGEFFQAQTLSVTQYLQKKLMEETMDGPLTDYGYSDSDSNISPSTTRNSKLKPSETLTARTSPTVTSASPKTIRNKERDALRRNNKRKKQLMADGDGVKLHAKRRRIDALKEALQIKFDLQKDIIVTTTGWQGGRTGPLPKKNFTKEEVQRDYGLVHFPWDGRRSHLLLDKGLNIIGILLGKPRHKAEQPGEWDAVCQDAFEALKLAASSMAFSEKESNHRRGPFPSVPHGISFGGGQAEPKHLSHGSEVKNQILENVMMQKSIQRICNFASEGLRLYSERNYKYMKDTMEALREHYDECLEPQRRLRRPQSPTGLFRWVENGFMSEASWLAGATEEQIQERLETHENRWAAAANMFTTLQELIPKEQK
ncbi:hypothetical protein H0H93_009906 [Arthromyces matolae]|nr:hypothetical protein H0H93_009906 [Arthromyces matolae]